MSEKRSFVRFVVALLAPFVLIFAGAGVAALGFKLGWMVLIAAGLIVAGIGLLWGLVMLFISQPILFD
jgi:hypothetical protein